MGGGKEHEEEEEEEKKEEEEKEELETGGEMDVIETTRRAGGIKCGISQERQYQQSRKESAD